MIKLNNMPSTRYLRTLVSEDVLWEEIRSVHIPQLDNLEREQPQQLIILIVNRFTAQQVLCKTVQIKTPVKICVQQPKTAVHHQYFNKP